MIEIQLELIVEGGPIIFLSYNHCCQEMTEKKKMDCTQTTCYHWQGFCFRRTAWKLLDIQNSEKKTP